MPPTKPAHCHVRRGGSLVDLLAGVAAGGILIAAALPLAAATRNQSSEAICAGRQAALTRAISAFAVDFSVYPVSYAYGSATTGPGWNPGDQLPSHPSPLNGYVHWSAVLLDGAYERDPKSVTCPDMPRGGAPRSNPGAILTNWEVGQLNTNGGGPGSPLPADRQAIRMAFTANAAIMPRNRLVNVGGSPRWNQLVSAAAVRPVRPTSPLRPASTILLTEFAFLPGANPWNSLRDDQGVIKSHRPLTPFLGLSAGTNVYAEPNSLNFARFAYPAASAILPANQLTDNLLGNQFTELNAVGRHHTGGTANFAYLDGSVKQSTVQQTVARRQWGDRFYSITGNNAVAP